MGSATSSCTHEQSIAASAIVDRYHAIDVEAKIEDESENNRAARFTPRMHPDSLVVDQVIGDQAIAHLTEIEKVGIMQKFGKGRFFMVTYSKMSSDEPLCVNVRNDQGSLVVIRIGEGGAVSRTNQVWMSSLRSIDVLQPADRIVRVNDKIDAEALMVEECQTKVGVTLCVFRSGDAA